ncbi:ActR/PrrA/RegA family redox response regulator transcription factor [Eilatimonas milleporae]|uniref:Two-component system response regulator RegA n=1 Tax=Eilatimonas milleporae TaxID=911205 RepID=A0A3M0C1V5_9PROT|nr:ActR/PrrA/RegA family redox response regulator transcription factor [Eilatimonas milleporae]RMB02865.1 two-component system response regulator RegA [Eilatimonas milleporae]
MNDNIDNQPHDEGGAGAIALEADDSTLLIVEDDRAFRQRLRVTLERRGFQVVEAESLEQAGHLSAMHKPRFAIVDMRLGDGNGLDLVPTLRQVREDMRIVILTGYGNIASAVSAVKAGAVDYLAKPADADEIAAVLLTPEGASPPPPDNPMSADRVKWEHIQRVYEMCDRNVSETARRLNMHRRTLQRILAKRSPH